MKIKLKQIWESLFPVSNNRTTNENITHLNPNEIFVFGSNTGGFHGAGAAHTALKWGAKMGNGFGLQGNTYALPTKKVVSDGKNKYLQTMEINEIKPYIDEFINFAVNNKNKTFLVTKIGTGLAGIPIEEIAILFIPAYNVKNIYLPLEFWNVLDNKSSFI